MLETIYVVIAILFFFAQVRNGFFTAALTAIFWPIVLAGLTIFGIVTSVYYAVKK